MSAPVLLHCEGVPGRQYVATACAMTDAEIEVYVKPMRDFWIRGHGEANVPPTYLLVLAFRSAWKHFAGPRRKLYHPGLPAKNWAMEELHLLCMCWVARRPDSKGTWRQHQEIANWPRRLPAATLSHEGGGTGSAGHAEEDVPPPLSIEVEDEPAYAVGGPALVPPVVPALEASAVPQVPQGTKPLTPLDKAILRARRARVEN